VSINLSLYATTNPNLCTLDIILAITDGSANSANNLYNTCMSIVPGASWQASVPSLVNSVKNGALINIAPKITWGTGSMGATMVLMFNMAGTSVVPYVKAILRTVV